MTACELSENIGKTAELTVTLGKREELRLAVTIIDVREVYGRTDYRVEIATICSLFPMLVNFM